MKRLKRLTEEGYKISEAVELVRRPGLASEGGPSALSHSVAVRYKYVPSVDKHVSTVRCAPISVGFTQKFATRGAVGERSRENGHMSPCVAAYNLANACRPRAFSARVQVGDEVVMAIDRLGRLLNTVVGGH